MLFIEWRPKRPMVKFAILRDNFFSFFWFDSGDKAWSFNCSLSRRSLVYVLVASPCLLLPALSSSAKTKSKSPYDERRLLEQNKRIQRENNAPDEFPNFVREGLSFYSLFLWVLFILEWKKNMRTYCPFVCVYVFADIVQVLRLRY